MTAERWREVEAVLQEALDRSAGERTAFLDSRCAQDTRLRSEVEALLKFDHATGSAVAAVVQEAARDLPASPVAFDAPERIGAYRLIREVGRGGMGTVYLAEREGEFRKEVAIKLVTRGMDTASLLDRFRNERQILARLEHPHIARLLDGGSTENGRPYLVMEYVAGTGITAWCGQRRLDTRSRIELFRKVCSAVQYAHQNLIVHRDLKPGNILVDAEGSPKLLDFGIAKLMDAGEGYQTVMMTGVVGLMTPDYASPEQARGEALTTATDVYSLGAILYELLTGVRPHRIDTYTPQEIQRAICETNLPRPSTAARNVLAPGDLDNVILMALQKDPARRYASAAEFSDDLDRYLNRQPVRARADTFGYRTGKFVRRNQAGVLAAGLLVASLAGGIAMTTVQARRAERRFEQVRRIAGAVLYDIHDAVKNLPGSTKAREIVVKTSLDYLDGLRREAANDPALLADMAAAYLRVGNVQGDVAGRSLGKTADGLDSIGKGLRIAEDLARRGVRTQQTASTLMLLYQTQGDMLAFSGKNAAGQASYDKGVAAGEALLARDPSNKDYLLTLAKIYRCIGRDENSARALKAARRAVEINARLANSFPNDGWVRFELAQSYGALGTVLRQRLELNESVDILRKSVAIREQMVQAEPDNAQYRQQLDIAYSALGDVLGNPTMANIGDRAGALEAYGKSLAIARKQSQEDPDDIGASTGVGVMLARVANVMPENDAASALRALAESRDILERWARKDPKNFRVRQHLIYTLIRTGHRLAMSGGRHAALRSYRDAIQWAEPMARADANDLTTRRLMIESYRGSAEVLAQLNDRSAVDVAGKAVVLAEAYGVQDPTNPISLARAPQAYAIKGAVYAALAEHNRAGAKYTAAKEDLRQASDWFRKSVDAWQPVQSRGMLTTAQAGELEKSKAEAAWTAAELRNSDQSHDR